MKAMDVFNDLADLITASIALEKLNLCFYFSFGK